MPSRANYQSSATTVKNSKVSHYDIRASDIKPDYRVTLTACGQPYLEHTDQTLCLKFTTYMWTSGPKGNSQKEDDIEGLQ